MMSTTVRIDSATLGHDHASPHRLVFHFRLSPIMQAVDDYQIGCLRPNHSLVT